MIIIWSFLSFLKDLQKILWSMICISISEVKGPQKGCESDYKRSIDKMMFYSDTLTLVNNNDFSNVL